MEKVTELLERYPRLRPCGAAIEAAIGALRDMYERGGKVLLCGNGGSAADCEHIVGELAKGFLLPRPMTEDMQEKLRELFPRDAESFARLMQRGIPAISLPSQTAVQSAYGNDVDAEYFYAQLVQVYGKDGDVLLCLSTSGNSANVCRAAQMAKAMGLCVIALTGAGPCKLDPLSDVVIHVPERDTFKIQELHLPVYHAVCAQLEQDFFA